MASADLQRKQYESSLQKIKNKMTIWSSNPVGYFCTNSQKNRNQDLDVFRFQQVWARPVIASSLNAEFKYFGGTGTSLNCVWRPPPHVRGSCNFARSRREARREAGGRRPAVPPLLTVVLSFRCRYLAALVLVSTFQPGECRGCV